MWTKRKIAGEDRMLIRWPVAADTGRAVTVTRVVGEVVPRKASAPSLASVEKVEDDELPPGDSR